MRRIVIRFDQRRYDSAPAPAPAPSAATESTLYSITLSPRTMEKTFVPGQSRVVVVNGNLYDFVQAGTYLPRRSPLRRAVLSECIQLAERAPGREVSSTPIPIPILI